MGQHRKRLTSETADAQTSSNAARTVTMLSASGFGAATAGGAGGGLAALAAAFAFSAACTWSAVQVGRAREAAEFLCSLVQCAQHGKGRLTADRVLLGNAEITT